MVGKRLGADPFQPSAVGRAHAGFLAGDREALAGVVRSEVAESWERSRRIVPPVLDHAPVLEQAPERWRSGRMAAAFGVVGDQLVQVAEDGDFVAAVTDETGAIVWMAGGRTMRRRAELVGFAPGGRWDEEAVGTNALALALRTGRPSTVLATEHYSPIVQDWVCYSAPIHDPVTGARAGVLDLSTTWTRANPLALATVTAIARNLEHAFAAAVPAPAGLRLRLLGGGDVLLGGERLLLPPRQVELLAILGLAPGGLSLEVLHDRLHGERPVSPATTKAELSHLRRVIGGHLASRPYRLHGEWEADHVSVLDLLAAGRLDEAVERYRGPLLPRSTAPAIEEHRHVVAVAVRAAVLRDPSPSRLAALRRAMPEDAHLADLAELAARPLPGRGR